MLLLTGKHFLAIDNVKLRSFFFALNVWEHWNGIEKIESTEYVFNELERSDAVMLGT